ncbi:hypothetical protein [Pseudovibrio exalbescens]|uniref:Uncharacterized protein n=1 Tax=Pseudovibrio exalbescens TaxID=197461 RepID=A0A1U7JG93_9HYPH|nr:hypothetical protein [Pseudovibrio exalbescens]OKL43763.1 hypothetical protein A3843_11605 [Pseudovibrio exalbescens]
MNSIGRLCQLRILVAFVFAIGFAAPQVSVALEYAAGAERISVLANKTIGGASKHQFLKRSRCHSKSAKAKGLLSEQAKSGDSGSNSTGFEAFSGKGLTALTYGLGSPAPVFLSFAKPFAVFGSAVARAPPRFYSCPI